MWLWSGASLTLPRPSASVVAARLDIAGEVDGRLPAAEIAIAQVLGCGVRAFDDVLVEHVAKLGIGVQPRVLLVWGCVRKVRTQRDESLSVLGLPTDDGAHAFALGNALRSFDPRPPRERFEGGERRELAEGSGATRPSRVRAAGPDAGRIDRERGEQPVDVVDDAEGRGAGVTVGSGWHQPIGRGIEDSSFVGLEETHQSTAVVNDVETLSG